MVANASAAGPSRGRGLVLPMRSPRPREIRISSSPDLLVEDGSAGSSANLREVSSRQNELEFPRASELKIRILRTSLPTSLIRRLAQNCNVPLMNPRERAGWLDDYALFMALKDSPDLPMDKLAEKLAGVNPQQSLLPARIIRCDRRTAVHSVPLFRQLDAVKLSEEAVEAHRRCSHSISADSSDVWSNPYLFLLDRNGHRKAVAGVPPDAFSETGQRSGKSAR